eukprot:Opistho-2@94476
MEPSSWAGGTPPCLECNGPVYMMERIVIENDAYHANCFKCCECGAKLTTATYRRDRQRHLYCAKHGNSSSPRASPGGSPATLRHRNVNVDANASSSPSTMSPATERRTSLSIVLNAGQGGRRPSFSPLGSPRTPRSPRSPRGSCTGDSETLVTWRRLYRTAKDIAGGLVQTRTTPSGERDDTFYADDMLAWLVESGNAATRGDALGLCERLQLMGGLRPIAENEPFRDSHDLCAFSAAMLDGSEGPLSTSQVHRALRASITSMDGGSVAPMATTGPLQSNEEAVRQMIRRTDGWIIEDAPVAGPFVPPASPVLKAPPSPTPASASAAAAAFAAAAPNALAASLLQPEESSVHPLEHLDPDAGEYRAHFFGKEHGNYYATAEMGGPAVISIRKDKIGADEVYRAILRTMTKDYRGQVSIASAVSADGRGRGKPTVEGIAKTVSAGACAVERWLPCFHADSSDCMFKYDENGIVRQYKFGIVYGKDGQTTEEQFFGNCEMSPAFDEFLNMMGERVSLLGFTKYRAGLDVKYEMTGDKSVYTTWCRREVMFHVSNLLPFTEGDPQQVQRKRHIGNDIVSIVFHEGTTPFIPTCIKSHFLHVYVVVQPDVLSGGSSTQPARYRVSVVHRDGVPSFGPAASAPTIVERGPALREYLLAKMMNGENASYKAPNFARLVQRTRNGLLRDMVDTFSRAANDEKSPAAAAMLKRTKALGLVLLDDDGTGADGEEKPKNRLLDSLRTLRKPKTLSRTNSDDAALAGNTSAPSSPTPVKRDSLRVVVGEESERRLSASAVDIGGASGSGGGFKMIRHDEPDVAARDRSKSDVAPLKPTVGRTASLVLPLKPEKEKLSLAEMLFEMDQFDDDGDAPEEGASGGAAAESEREKKDAEADKKKSKAQLLQENKALRAHLVASEVEKARLHNRVSLLGGDTVRIKDENQALKTEVQALKNEAQKLKVQLKLLQQRPSA